MLIEYNVEIFKTNDPTLSPHHVIYDIRYSIDRMGNIHTNFRTLAKYYDVNNGGTLHDGHGTSQLIEISPFILDEHGNDIADYSVKKYRNHPDWFFMVLEIKSSDFNDDSFIPIITPTKHEYHVAHIPIDYALGHDLEYTPSELVVNTRNNTDV